MSADLFPQPVIIHRKIDVINALADLGVDLETLEEAVLAGESARASCTENDPPGAGGMFSYARTTRRLFEILIPGYGWKRKMDKNFPLAVRPDGLVALSVTTGDEGTGVPYRNVKTRYPKGTATESILEDNRQLELAYGHEESDAETEEAAARTITWFLLRRRWQNFLYWELSLPLHMEEKEPVSQWARRIILPTITFDPETDIGSDDDREDEEIDVQIGRR